jgi:hypothetical protein
MPSRFGGAIPLPSALSSVTRSPVRPHVDPTPAAPTLAALDAVLKSRHLDLGRIGRHVDQRLTDTYH